MADNTKIEWADATVNAINGCSVTSPGCTNCYAMKLAGTRMKTHPTRAGLTIESKAGPVWTGEVRLHEPALLQPLSWSKPRRIFWNAHGDTFHDAVPDDWIDRIFAVAALTPQHTHMILTKRSKRMREYMSACEVRVAQLTLELACATGKSLDDPRRHPAFRMVGEWGASIMDAPTIDGFEQWPVPNVWLGVSVEDQTRADERIPDLLATPAAVRFLSCEPLLGPVDLRWIAEPDDEKNGVIDALLGCNWIEHERGEEFRPARPGHQDRIMRRWVCSHEVDILANRKLDWVIAGGESCPGARPMHPDWARSLRDQCAAAGVTFHFKQWGEWLPWSEGCLPEWESQSGLREDRHNLFPDDIDTDPRWDDGIWAIPGHEHFAFQRVGKKRAGRLLDGVEHNGMPESASA